MKIVIKMKPMIEMQRRHKVVEWTSAKQSTGMYALYGDYACQGVRL